MTSAASVGSQPTLDGSRVTPELLFRGGSSKAFPGFFDGETIGPYVSQLALTPTQLGAARISQQLDVLPAGADYMKTLSDWADVQNGASPPKAKPVGQAYLHDGRGLASYTHVDELYQAYLIAFLVLESSNMPVNPGSPYTASPPSRVRAAWHTWICTGNDS